MHLLARGRLVAALDRGRDPAVVLVDRPVPRAARAASATRCVCSTANTGCAAIESSVLPQAAITHEWKSRL